MVAKGDDTLELVAVRVQRSRDSPSEERETRRRKTPERRAATGGLAQPTAGDSVVDADVSVSSVVDRVETRRTKTPERRSPSRQQKISRKTPERNSPSRKVKVSEGEDTAGLEQPSTEKDLSGGSESRSAAKTPERKSPARKLELEEEKPSRKTPERRTPSRKARKLSGGDREASVLEDSSSERDSSPVRPRRKTPERKSASRTAVKSSASSQDTSSAALAGTEGEEVEEIFEAGEIVMESLQVPQSEVSSEVPSRRRSTRLNTPDRSVVEFAGAKRTLRGSSRQRETTPSRQENEKESESSPNQEKFSSAEEVLNDVVAESETSISHEVSGRRRSTRLNTPDRSLAEVVRARSATPTRVTRKRGETPQRQQQQDEEESSSREDRAVTPTRQSARKKLQAAGKAETSESFVAEDEIQEPPSSLRKSRRLSKTPERLISSMTETIKTPVKAESGPVSARKSKREAKTPLKAIAEESQEPVVRSKRQSRTPEDMLEQDSDKDESVLEPAEGHNLRRSRRQSKTPDRQSARGSVEPATPTRRSRRQHKTPEVLNTDEIEPVLASSPMRQPKDTLPEPATPPKMSAKKSEAETEKEQTTTATPQKTSAKKSEKRQTASRSARRSPGRKVALAPLEEEEDAGKETADAHPVTRRSARKAKSPERLNTEQIQPVSPHGSPTRSKTTHTASDATAQATDQTDEAAHKNTLAQSATERETTAADNEEEPVRSFQFSPPVSHPRHSKTGHADDAESADDLATGATTPTRHHFVFSSPSVASPPKVEEKKSVKSKRTRKLHKLYTEDEVSLLSPVATPAAARQVSKRKVSGTQRAAALLMNRSKQQMSVQSRKLVPSVKVGKKSPGRKP
ncbi:hypothetical protein EGW08_019638 [Elysia chlorotica]|uniref:Uncharacterized protein n=1 Tax=Elysia chlorotica TaxID=188477 RepID=A0A433STJ5_ELYCH|nr:hypothetical protein EGW08_019638 [Elysia chlorotica]